EGGTVPLLDLARGDADLPLRPGDLQRYSAAVLVADHGRFDVVAGEDADELALRLVVRLVQRLLPGRGQRLLRARSSLGDDGVVGAERGRLGHGLLVTRSLVLGASGRRRGRGRGSRRLLVRR